MTNVPFIPSGVPRITIRMEQNPPQPPPRCAICEDQGFVHMPWYPGDPDSPMYEHPCSCSATEVK